jgi:zinc D-Ala-D-Ala carboxypeptidase
MFRTTCVLVATTLLAACGTRAPRTTPPSDEPRSPAPAEPVTIPTAVTEPPPSQAPVVESQPQPRMPWMNPARCVSPCTYEPQADLVRVDDQGSPDSTGAHLVHRTIQEPLRALVGAAHAAGHKVRIESAFRSYNYQAELFRKTKQRGRAARPGHSEHQLGTAVDFRMPTTAAIDWLGEHASAHGFVLSYPNGKQRITGYRPEPWHARYVGDELASELRKSGSTLEEMFRARPDVGESGTCEDCPLSSSRTACGTVTVVGRCDGTVLEWCFDGALATVDCAASKQRCGRDKGAEQYDCVGR